jgi:glutathione S-transferase
LFAVLDAHLARQDWLGDTRVTMADIANYSYIAHAPEGGVSLADYPQIRAWLRRIEALPRFVPMQRSAG